MVVCHVAITAAEDYLERRVPHRQAHLDRLMGLRSQGTIIGGGPAPDGRSADIFYRVRHPSDVTRLIEEDPYQMGGVWTGYSARTFAQFVEPWELPPLVTDGSRKATIVEGIATDPEMAPFALIELRGKGLLAFGGLFDGGGALAFLKTGDQAQAIGWLSETGIWTPESLTSRPLLWAL
jgi:uncharacterized protein YciI